MKITLITNYYRTKTADRQKEIDFCLNENNGLGINMLCVGAENPKIDGIEFVEAGERLTFADLFNAGNKIDGIKIIANSDMYFDSSIHKLSSLLTSENAMCLTRYEKHDGKWVLSPHGGGCQDAWGWLGEVNFIEQPRYCLGVPGCDHRIAQQLSETGRTLINPASTIKSYHLHKTDERNYLKTIKGQYKFVNPT